MTRVGHQLHRSGGWPGLARVLAAVRGARAARAVLLLSLAVAWLNFLLTSRWANVPGTLHGWRRPYYTAALVAVTALALTFRLAARPVGRTLPRLTLAGSVALLVAAFVSWFPVTTWSRIPFLDNWPPRFQSTVEGIALLRQGAVGGWQWAFLGGYHSVSDITQNLAVLGFIPMSLLGAEIGFHLLHALLFGAIPLLVFIDLKDEDLDVALLAAAISCLLVGNFSYLFIRSGDTNSVAGVVCTALALVGSHAARRGRRFGVPTLVLGLTLTAYSHVGFLAYAVGYLALEAAYYRDGRAAIRGLAALAIALVASLPLTWELWRYPAYFYWNNLAPGPPAPIDWAATAKKVFYNVEILFRPGRWANDYTGITAVFLPLIALVACQRRSRSAFYAVAALVTVLVVRLNVSAFGYLFLRPVHMFTLFTPAALAYFVVRLVGRRWLAIALVVLFGLYMQITFQHVPHVTSITAFDAGLVQHLRSLDGHLVLLENNPHRNMNASEGGQSEASAFGVHFESLLPAATGKRFYAGYWDGWQWSPWRAQTVAAGTFRGKPIGDTPHEAFAAEMRRWGIRHLVVWSDGSHAYLNADSRFLPRWSEGRWTDYELLDADPRSVVTPHGEGRLKDVDWLGARVDLTDVRAGDEVIVRTNAYPAWQASGPGAGPVALYSRGGQLAFAAPRSGTYAVTLSYPRRAWLSVASLFVAGLAAVCLTLADRRVR